MPEGPPITPGYTDRPEATAQAMRDGWFATGDIGSLDEGGYLSVLDRRADLMISGSENVSPAEIESVLAALEYRLRERCHLDRCGAKRSLRKTPQILAINLNN